MSFFFFSSRRRHTRFDCDWSSDVCSSDLAAVWRSDNARNSNGYLGRGGESEYGLPFLAGARSFDDLIQRAPWMVAGQPRITRRQNVATKRTTIFRRATVFGSDR